MIISNVTFVNRVLPCGIVPSMQQNFPMDGFSDQKCFPC